MMKAIILSIGLISTINASQRLLQQVSCSNVRCAGTCTDDSSGAAVCCDTECVDGYCNTNGLTGNNECVLCAATTCVQGQECVQGVGCQDIECGSFEEYNFCGSACPASCDNQSPGPCITLCVPGCFCQDGYIRDSNDRCILESECPSSGCGTNEVFSQCNGHCRPTCETGPNIICTKQCEAGCNCADGYILDETDGTCIPDTDCPSDPEPTLPPGCALILCQVGSTCCDDGNGGATCCAATSPECPLRCENGFDGCNDCFCDGLGNTGGCTRRGCPNGDTAPAGCTNCEVGYALNTITNECELAKVSCTNNGDCDSGFKCRKDPECMAYSDLSCADAGKVCVRRRNSVCTSDSDCNESNGFGCLDGDVGDGICVKYQ